MKKLITDNIITSPFELEEWRTTQRSSLSDKKKGKKGKKQGKENEDEGMFEHKNSQMGKKSKGISTDPSKPKKGNYGD